MASQLLGFRNISVLKMQDVSPTPKLRLGGPSYSSPAPSSKPVQHGWLYQQPRCRLHSPKSYCSNFLILLKKLMYLLQILAKVHHLTKRTRGVLEAHSGNLRQDKLCVPRCPCLRPGSVPQQSIAQYTSLRPASTQVNSAINTGRVKGLSQRTWARQGRSDPEVADSW